MAKTLLEVFQDENLKKRDETGLPIRPTEVLPNGATVVDIRWTAPPPFLPVRWFILAVWLRGGKHEYIVWELLPDSLQCDSGFYTPELAHAEKNLTERVRNG
jgi:hypothetical protein